MNIFPSLCGTWIETVPYPQAPHSTPIAKETTNDAKPKGCSHRYTPLTLTPRNITRYKTKGNRSRINYKETDLKISENWKVPIANDKPCKHLTKKCPQGSQNSQQSMVTNQLSKPLFQPFNQLMLIFRLSDDHSFGINQYEGRQVGNSIQSSHFRRLILYRKLIDYLLPR